MGLYILGDIHGRGANLRMVLGSPDQYSKDDFVISVGDFSAEYGDMVMGDLKKACKKYPCTFIVMRGNHDNCYWKKHLDQKGWSAYRDSYLVQDKYPNIWYVRDEGGIYEIGGYNFLFLPGAYSVDRYYRLKRGLPYNYDEQLTKEEQEQILNKIFRYWATGKNIDYIISHTYPYSIEDQISDLFMSNINQSKVDKSTEYFCEQVLKFYSLYSNDDFKHWYFGHLHADREINDKMTLVYQTLIKLKGQKWQV